MSRPNDIVKGRKQDYKTCHKHAIVHSVSRDRRRDWPETEEEDNDAKSDAECIVDDAKDTRNVKRSPNEGAGLGGVRGDLVLRADSTRKATPEEESFDKDVGCVEGGDGERDDVVESSKRADIDETENHTEDGGDKDCEDGDGGCWVDLSTKLQYVSHR